MNIKSVLVIHTTPTFNDLQGKEALDLSLILGSYEQDVAVVFYKQGVFQTLAHQDAESISQKDYISTIKALDIYDIDKVYAHSDSLNQFGLTDNERLSNIETIEHSDFIKLKSNADHIFVI
ncbi:sulfurtransferase complex subunit TusC [Psychrosphaera aestuarii]|uniref:sulfurtransferase complex subunit TusC n=1 Tax=Psychrosphaera aestuarii TaxID=1266052 RepID=UPI001B327D96|nr:sulfurtransferase complex subunit TusC [Psychrosphaera aestuarii]